MLKAFTPLLLFAGLLACTAPIDINTDDSDPVLVIYGTLTDSLCKQSIRLSSSSPFFENKENARISDASVVITSSENETFQLQENDSIKGLYQTLESMAGKVGVNYHLSVMVDFNKDGTKEKFEADALMKSKMQFDSITIIPIDILGVKHYRIGMYGPEPLEENFYLWKYYQNDSLITPNITQYQVTIDAGFNGTYVTGLTIGYFEDISAKADYSETDAKKRTFLTSGDTLRVEMSNIEKGHFQFIVQCQKEFRGENPFFGGPASNIKTNITNGGLGYFAAYAISQASAITP